MNLKILNCDNCNGCGIFEITEDGVVVIDISCVCGEKE